MFDGNDSGKNEVGMPSDGKEKLENPTAEVNEGT